MNCNKQHCDPNHHDLLYSPTDSQILVFVGAESIKFMEALKNTALNLLLFWYLSKVNGPYFGILELRRSSHYTGLL